MDYDGVSKGRVHWSSPAQFRTGEHEKPPRDLRSGPSMVERLGTSEVASVRPKEAAPEIRLWLCGVACRWWGISSMHCCCCSLYTLTWRLEVRTNEKT